MTDTARLTLPLLAPAQAQKHVTVNEALRLLDGMVQAAVLRADLGTPPAAPEEGQAWLVAPGAVNDWAGWEGDIALWTDGAWLRLRTGAGWRVWDRAAGDLLLRGAGGWVPLTQALGAVTQAGLASGAVAALGINAATDATNGFVFRGTNALLQSDTSIDATLNKAQATGDASFTFKTGYSARALVGLLGDDDFAVKVSADGATFTPALGVDRATGRVRAEAGLRVAPGTAAAPGIAFIGDADTGFRRGAADQIGFVTGGVQRAALSDAALVVDVPLGGLAVTQGAGDATAGRILKVGDFGIGGVAVAVADLSALGAGGVYAIAAADAGAAGAPGAGDWVVTHLSRDAGHAVQTARGATGTYRRDKVAGVWGTWRRAYDHASILAPVGFAGGVPTGGVIERGGNANGDYVRFADGTLIATSPLFAGVNMTTATGALFTTAGGTWTLPVAFVNAWFAGGGERGDGCARRRRAGNRHHHLGGAGAGVAHWPCDPPHPDRHLGIRRCARS